MDENTPKFVGKDISEILYQNLYKPLRAISILSSLEGFK